MAVTALLLMVWNPTVEDEFDILNLRLKLRETIGAERRKPRRTAAEVGPPEPRGPSLFEWAGVEELAATVEHDESAPLGPPTAWPPMHVVPASADHRARPFGRRVEGGDGAFDDGVMHLVDVAGYRTSANGQAAAQPGDPLQRTARRGPGALTRRYVDETPEVPPDPIPGDPLHSMYRPEAPLEAEFTDLMSPDELAAAERAAEDLRHAISRLGEADARKAGPAEALLNSLVNKLLLERDRLEACMSDHQAPLVLSPLRRRRGERNHVDLSTANDRG